MNRRLWTDEATKQLTQRSLKGFRAKILQPQIQREAVQWNATAQNILRGALAYYTLEGELFYVRVLIFLPDLETPLFEGTAIIVRKQVDERQLRLPMRGVRTTNTEQRAKFMCQRGAGILKKKMPAPTRPDGIIPLFCVEVYDASRRFVRRSERFRIPPKKSHPKHLVPALPLST